MQSSLFMRGLPRSEFILKCKLGEEIFPVSKKRFSWESDSFGQPSHFMSLQEYEVKSQVPATVFKEFVDFLQGGKIVVSKENYDSLRLLAEEFQLGGLTLKCDIFQAWSEPPLSDTGLLNRGLVSEAVCIGPGHRVRITVKGRSVTYEVLRSLRETDRFSMDLSDAKTKGIKIEGIDGSDGLVEKAVAAVYSNTLVRFGDDETKKPFLVMVLWRLYTFWYGLWFESMLYCLNRLNEIAPTGFDKARLLLLSQCRQVSPPDFVPLSNADPDILSNAITMLMAENNGRRRDADILLEQMKDTGRYNCRLERNGGC